MASVVFVDELEKEISLMYQTMNLKKVLLEECREKLQSEIAEHKEAKCSLLKYIDENKELKKQLEVSLAAVQKLEEENYKNREILVKLEIQVESHQNERQQLLDRCYLLEVENSKLKNEEMDLKEQLKVHCGFQESLKVRQLQTECLVNEILSKQEILNKEQARLEEVCKEGLQFTARLSEEAKFQAKFVREANDDRKKMEEELIHVKAALTAAESKMDKPTCERCNSPTYLKEWESYQEDMTTRVEGLLKENKRLTEELEVAETQLNHFLNGGNFGDLEMAAER